MKGWVRGVLNKRREVGEEEVKWVGVLIQGNLNLSFDWLRWFRGEGYGGTVATLAATTV